VTRVDRNQSANNNSIMTVLADIGDQRPDIKHVRIVSPYLFLAEYRDDDGNLVRDEAQEFRDWIETHPDATLEIVTNSVLTSDNFPAQSVIDMETAPRLVLPPDMRQAWLDLKSGEELTAELVHSDRWRELVNNPRVILWETGRMDSKLLGGDRAYGKLHAKFLFTEIVGFVGTTNFDYRSRLYNNEMGFFFDSEELIGDLLESFEQLVSFSYRWGSPEWLEMRRQVMDKGDIKGRSTERQRSWYRFFRKTGIIWLL
jgi:phosphatidylserine/phosphatidylglycerophosphate/cardiolipin synthase-like enzyme